ncbi:TPA: hypothetical protein DIC39_01000 [Patescibacteria group bacterium]|nr:hypothetical protein [Patescibacteria group bacterium]
MSLLPETVSPPTPQATTRGKFFLYLVLILVLAGLTWWSRQPHVQATLADWEQHTVWENIKRLTGADDKLLTGENDGRINIMLLGMGGVKHDGPYLTDTIILASLNPTTSDLALLSIPRDMAVSIPGNGVRKINSANAYGEAREPGSGAKLASEALSSTLQVPIHYYFRIDFGGLVSLIHQLGGLKINVDRAFVDNQYPSNDSLVQTISFAAGEQLMSGERVLEYVRSRHGSAGEGSDFARARRQQKVLIAFKEKLLRLSTFLNPSLLVKLYSTLEQNIETNVETWEMLKFAKILKKVNTDYVVHQVLDPETNPLLVETRGADGAYLLVPRTGDYNELQEFVQNLFQFSAASQEQATIMIANGTAVPGLAESTARELTSRGLKVSSFGNADNKNYPTTLLHDLSAGKTATREAIMSILKLSEALTTSPNFDAPADFVIILGQDSI